MSLPSQRNLTASIKTLINGKPTSAVLDTAAIVTLVRDDDLTDFKTQGQMGPVCVLTGIGTDPVHGRIMYNVPITVGSQTFLDTVCVAPVKDTCLLGLYFLSATASVLDLGNETLTIGEDDIPVNVIMTPEHQFSKVTTVRRKVVQLNSVGLIKVELDTPIEGSYIVEGCPSKHALSSRVYGEGKYITLKVVNGSDKYLTYQKGKTIGHAESVVSIADPEQVNILKCATDTAHEEQQLQQPNECSDERVQGIPTHLQQMYLDNISELSENQKTKFKTLISKYADVFSKVDFDLGCLNTGVEHKIQTFDEIPINEKFRHTPLQFQKQEQEYVEKLLKQGVIEPSMSEYSSAPVLVRKKKTGELRYCIDYRSLNAKTYKDNKSLLLIDDCLDSLYGNRVFCVLDLCSGYYQMPLESGSKHNTSFSFGSFQWLRPPPPLSPPPPPPPPPHWSLHGSSDISAGHAVST